MVATTVAHNTLGAAETISALAQIVEISTLNTTIQKCWNWPFPECLGASCATAGRVVVQQPPGQRDGKSNVVWSWFCYPKPTAGRVVAQLASSGLQSAWSVPSLALDSFEYIWAEVCQNRDGNVWAPCSEQWILHDPAKSCPAAVRLDYVGLQLWAPSCLIILTALRNSGKWSPWNWQPISHRSRNSTTPISRGKAGPILA